MVMTKVVCIRRVANDEQQNVSSLVRLRAFESEFVKTVKALIKTFFIPQCDTRIFLELQVTQITATIIGMYSKHTSFLMWTGLRRDMSLYWLIDLFRELKIKLCRYGTIEQVSTLTHELIGAVPRSG
jgi:hypothetical protein